MHRLAQVLRSAAEGRFPPVDGVAEIVPPDGAGAHAVVAFTGHAYVLTDLDPTDVARFRPDGYGAAAHPRLLVHLAGDGGGIGSHDVVLVRRGAPGVTSLADRTDLEDHPRVQRARRHRRAVRVLGDERGFVTIGSGLVDRTEMSVELTASAPGRGSGRALIADALRVLDADEFVFAQVAPGNAASLRVFFACGFVPIGSEIIIEPASAVSDR